VAAEAERTGSLVAGLQRELAAARAAAQREEGARLEAEERFRQAFLRGVCALNLEALQVLNGGAAEPLSTML